MINEWKVSCNKCGCKVDKWISLYTSRGLEYYCLKCLKKLLEECE